MSPLGSSFFSCSPPFNLPQIFLPAAERHATLFHALELPGRKARLLSGTRRRWNDIPVKDRNMKPE
jgi:hypothetical protein